MVYEKLEFYVSIYKMGTLAKCELNTDKNKYIFHNVQKIFWSVYSQVENKINILKLCIKHNNLNIFSVST